MRCAVTSDLHLGGTSWPMIQQALQDDVLRDVPAPDVLVLAGDNGEGPDRLAPLLRLLRAELPATPILFVLGNHDLWSEKSGRSMLNIFTSVASARWDRMDPLLHYLEARPYRVGRTAFLGTIGWYDYSARDPGTADRCDAAWYRKHKRRIMSAEYLNLLRAPSDIDFAAAVAEPFLRQLDLLEQDPTVEQIVVVTHVPVVEQQITRKPWDLDWQEGAAYFGNLTLGAEVLRRRKVRCIWSGHTHSPQFATVARDGAASVEVLVTPSDYKDPRFLTFDL